MSTNKIIQYFEDRGWMFIEGGDNGYYGWGYELPVRLSEGEQV